jgi:hypothetical protein
MKEGAWLSCAEPARMLGALRGKPNPRKLRLLVCACCRRLYGDRLRDPDSLAALETAERYADDLATKQELVAARRAAAAAREGSFRAKRAVWWSTYGRPQTALRALLNAEAPPPWRFASANPRGQRGNPGGPLAAKERAAVCDLFREVFNPFQTAAVDPGWLREHGGMVARLARAIYDERRFEDMPVLGDALEEAGCSDEAVLRHCRQPGGHVRGCWALDLLLNNG